MNINKINFILQKGGYPLFPPGYELPTELTLYMLEYLSVEQLLLLLNDDDTRPNVIHIIKKKMTNNRLTLDELVVLFNHPLFRKIVILYIIKELNKPNVSLLFVQNVYLKINNRGIRNKIILMINALYSSMFEVQPNIIIDIFTNFEVDLLLIKLAYIRIIRIVDGFISEYPEGIIGSQTYITNPGTSYNFEIEFTKPGSIKTYIVDPGYHNNDCNISTPDYIWQIVEECSRISLYNKLVELINNSYEYSNVLNELKLKKVTHMPATETSEGTTISQLVRKY